MPVSVNISEAIQLPSDAIRFLVRELRKRFFAGNPPSGRHFLVDASLDGIEAALGRQSYAPNWEFSYYKRGEVLNLARVVHEERTVDGRRYEWWQTHVRGWNRPDGIALHGHWELEPTEHANDHLDGVGFDSERGLSNLQAALEQSALSYAEVEIDR